jgi:hypothetical protein
MPTHKIAMLLAACALSAALAMAALLGGCGEDDEDEGRAQPKAKAPLSGELAGWNQAVASQKCAQFVPLVLSAVRNPGAKPGGPPVEDECRALNQTLEQNKGVKLEKSDEFGTAGIAEGPGPKQGPYSTYPAIFIVDWDGEYRFLTVGPADPQLGTKPKASTDFQGTADAFVKAVRDRNCDQFLKYVAPGSSFFRGAKNDRDACQAVFRGKNLAPQLAADKEAKPEKLGETLDLGFFGIATKKNYYTLIVTTKPRDGGPELQRRPEALVLDYVPNYRPAG